MFLFPWWLDLLLVATVGALLIKMAKLSREIKKLQCTVALLEGEEEVVEPHESKYGDAEGNN